MPPAKRYDAVVIGSGPNGLAAAVTLAQHGKSVLVYEAEETIGGGARSAALTLPGFLHDRCSAVYPLAACSPFFQSLPLAQYGLRWIDPPAPLAHPFPDGTALTVERSVGATARQLQEDEAAYRRLVDPLVRGWRDLRRDLLSPMGWPRHPWLLAKFGAAGIWPARRLARRRFRGARARALFAGLAAHSMLPLEFFGTAAFGLLLGAAAHAVGWPIAAGGAQRITAALAAHLQALGGEIVSSRPIESLEQLPACRALFCDLTPRQLLQLGAAPWSPSYRRKLDRYRYGLAAFKIDWALDAPVPWNAACRRAATVHLGASLDEIAASERGAWNGGPPSTPFVLLAQPSLFDGSRAPAGRHTLWAYCHVPPASPRDMTAAIEAQIERFAAGFRRTISARAVSTPADLEAGNANLVGGDINGGAALLRQLWFRPTRKTYRTSAEGIYLCSASAPPGGGVHGMCGYHAARRALRERF